MQEITKGRGCDLVGDSVGGATLQWSIECLAYRGRCITVGNASRDDTRPDVRVLAPGNRSLTGVFFGAEVAFQGARVREMLDAILRDLAKGDLRVIVDRTYPLREAAVAHAYIEGRAAFGRVVLIP